MGNGWFYCQQKQEVILIDFVHDIPILNQYVYFYTCRDHEKADVIFLSEESEQELTSESDGSPVNKCQR